MYGDSAAKAMTMQGRAIHDANKVFGVDGSLPFSVCKYKYQPVREDKERGQTKECVACWRHEKDRRRRFYKEGGSREYDEDFGVWWNR